VLREAPQMVPLPDESAAQLADRLAGNATSPSEHVVRNERRRHVKEALAHLSESDRELLVLRYLEQMPLKEIASVMGTTEGAVKTRHVRALQRLHDWLDQHGRR
jgi:RNA polymerase sigma-70 factor, ECF subfamily